MIAIVDTGGANLASVQNALKRLNTPFILTKDIKTIKSAKRVLLPGVGAALDTMARLKKEGLIDCIRGLTQPVLGICLGMQILYESSAEGETPCLSLIKGNVTKMEPKEGLTIPHMGWNLLEPRGDCRLIENLPENPYVYFVHSYRAPLADNIKAVSLYGTQIPAIVQQDNFYGCQFHPERSGVVGALILENFLR